MNAVKQQTARQSGCAMDKLKLSNAWDASGVPPGAELPVTLTGLFVQGATFSRGSLGIVLPTPQSSWRHQAWLSRTFQMVARLGGSTPRGSRRMPTATWQCLCTRILAGRSFSLRLSVPLHNDTPSTWVAAGAALFVIIISMTYANECMDFF